MINIMKKLFVLLLALGMLVSLCACGGNESANNESSIDITTEDPASDTSDISENNESSTPSTPEVTAAFTVTVIDQDGNPVKGAYIQLCKDSCIFKESNEQGIVSFDNEITDGYKLSVLVCPDGYTTENTAYATDAEGKAAEVYLNAGITEYTVEIVKVN